MTVTILDIRQAAQALELSGQALCVHASLRSFGWVEGGAESVINGLLAEGCTVLVPTFSWWFSARAPAGRYIPRNAYDYDRPPESWWEAERFYTPELSEVGEEMGIIAATLATMPSRVRGDHPISSFSAVGPKAQELIAGQQSLDVYAPLKRLATMGGLVVLMGVGLKRVTLLHLAEQMAGRNLFRRWARGRHGQVVEVAVGGCSEGFGNIEPFLQPLVRERIVGESLWRVLPAQETLEVAVKAIQEDPWLTHCGDPECERCASAVAGGPNLTGSSADT